jgi:hypothetical protein
MVYGQHVCLNSKLVKLKTGELKEVNLSYTGNTVCNNAWISVILVNRLTPVCETECEECKTNGRIYTHVFKPKNKRTLSKEHKTKLHTRK